MNTTNKSPKTQSQRITTFAFALSGEMRDGTRPCRQAADFATMFGGSSAHLESDLVKAAGIRGRDVVIDIWAGEPANQPCEIVVACHTEGGVELLRSCIPVEAGSSGRLALFAHGTGELVSIGNDGRIVREPLTAEDLSLAIHRGHARLEKVRKRLARQMNKPEAAPNDNASQNPLHGISVMVLAA